MGDCEVCGEEQARYVAVIEGARLQVCPDCARSGKIVAELSIPTPVLKKQAAQPGRTPMQTTETEVVSDYGRRIREARERRRLTRKQLAELVFEKESYLERVEAEKVLPSEALARRLEKALGIALFETVTAGALPSVRKREGPLTLGDLVIVKKKGKK